MKRNLLSIGAGTIVLAVITLITLMVCLDHYNHGKGTLHNVRKDWTYTATGKNEDSDGRRIVLLKGPDGISVLPELPKSHPIIKDGGKYKLSSDRKSLVRVK